MKKIYNSFIIGLLAVCGVSVMTSCSEDTDNFGKGTVRFNVDVNQYVEVKTREANTEELEKTCVLYVYQGENLVRKYRGLSNFEDLVLFSGAYRAEAYAGEYQPASFEKQYFEGSKEFTVEKGEISTVDVECMIANTVVSVSTDENVATVLSDIAFEVSSSEGNLTFKDETFDSKGYFMMPPNETTLKYALKGTYLTGDNIGGEFVRAGEITDVKPATEYAVKVTYNKNAGSFGGAYFDIVIDEKELIVEHNPTIEAAPHIAAPNDIPLGEVVVRKDELNHYIVYVAAVTELTSLSIESDRFASLGMMSKFDLITTSTPADIIAYGIVHEDKTLPEDKAEGKQLMMVEFNGVFFNKLNANPGEYAIKFSATDKNDCTTEATLTFVITEDKLIAEKAPSVITYNSVTLEATLADVDAVNPGFEYREAANTRAEAEWIKAPNVQISGTKVSVQISGLKAGVAYEYRVVWDGMNTTPPVYSFTTKAYPQLENASFEIWGEFKGASDKKNILTPSGSVSTMFWDCGNHGSQTLQNTKVTQQGTEYKNSGNLSAKLRSQFVGLVGVGKFAAGNIFIGQYLETDGTDGVIGFGRPFDFAVENGAVIKPKAIKVWVRYEPGKADDKGANKDYIKEGETDKGQIYIALCGESSDAGDTYDGVQYARVVRTKKSGQRLFDSEAANVVAYGEHTFEAATDGNGMIQVTIPFNDVHPTVVPKYVVFVASASKYGDFFSGGEGSTMWLDDVELVYE